MPVIKDDFISVSYSRELVKISNTSKENIYLIGLTNNELARTSWRPMKVSKPILPSRKKIRNEILDESDFDFYVVYYWFESDSADKSGVVDMKDVKMLKIDMK